MISAPFGLFLRKPRLVPILANSALCWKFNILSFSWFILASFSQIENVHELRPISLSVYAQTDILATCASFSIFGFRGRGQIQCPPFDGWQLQSARPEMSKLKFVTVKRHIFPKNTTYSRLSSKLKKGDYFTVTKIPQSSEIFDTTQLPRPGSPAEATFELAS